MTLSEHRGIVQMRSDFNSLVGVRAFTDGACFALISGGRAADEKWEDGIRRQRASEGWQLEMSLTLLGQPVAFVCLSIQ